MIVVGNWKMNGRKALVDEFSHLQTYTHHVVICPPFTHISYAQSVWPSYVQIGAQDCHFETQGAFTSCVSSQQLQDIGCQYVILGHSEIQDPLSAVRAKLENALNANLIPIVCLGESLEERQQGLTLKVLEDKKNKLFSDISKEKIILAYEPLWAIGTGCIPKPEEIREVHALFSDFLFLYGGSVTSETTGFFSKDVDGFLVGGASLNLKTFEKLLKSL